MGITAQRVASEEVLRYESVKLDDNIIKQIEEAERKNKIVAIVVDTWTLRLPRYCTYMSEYDGRNFLNCVVVVAWNNRDEELTEIERLNLEARLQETFKRNVVKADRNCFLEINSYDELVNGLPVLLNQARTWISKGTTVVKKAEGGPFIGKPLITGVRGASA